MTPMSDEDVRALLATFIEPMAGKPVRWGEDDCARFAAAWVTRLTGRDLSLPRWSSEAEARRLQADPGTETLWDIALGGAGFFRTQRPRLGDVGLIATRRFGPVGAICLGDGNGLWRTVDSVGALMVREWAAAWAVRP